MLKKKEKRRGEGKLKTKLEKRGKTIMLERENVRKCLQCCCFCAVFVVLLLNATCAQMLRDWIVNIFGHKHNIFLEIFCF